MDQLPARHIWQWAVRLSLGPMKSISVTEFSAMSAPELRLNEVKYLFECFKAARNSAPNCGLFLLTVYFDSLLFCLVSIEEMVDQATKDRLRALSSFSFCKALRNITGHHSILSSSNGKFERPVSRIVSVGVGCSVDFAEQFVLLPEKLEVVFDRILAERAGERKTIEKARNYLVSLRGKQGDILLVDAIQSAITEIEHVAQPSAAADVPSAASRLQGRG